MACKVLTALYVQHFTKSKYLCRLLSSEAAVNLQATSSGAGFRTTESNPEQQGLEHEGLYYTLPESVQKQLFQYGGFPKPYEKQTKSFGESCLMVRKPALDLIRYMKTADYSKPVIRYVLYGQAGGGKSLTLAHVLHYGFNSGHILIHIPWVPNWMKRSKEVATSTTKEGFIDLPMDAAAWLLHFKSQNNHLLSNPELCVAKEYVWSRRETTQVGAPLLEMIELGIKRVKYASDIIVALLKEIKNLSTLGRCKTLVAIDGFNSFFYEKTMLKDEHRKMVLPHQITFTEAFTDITKYDWCNGSVVLTVDRLVATFNEHKDSDFPLFQLGKKGFEHLDPFVPVNVPVYNEKEFHSCIDYYLDRCWLQNEKAGSTEGRNELLYLSTGNPYELMNVCAPL